MKIGPYTVSIIKAGYFRLDGGAMFGVVPKVLWNRICPADDLNRVEMTMNCLLIEGRGRRVLVDTGVGDKESERFKELYGVDTSRHSLSASLAACGLRPEDITDVVISHLHFDHAGGATRMDGSKAVPVFTQARHYVQRRHYEHALSPTERDRASFLPHNYLPLAEAGLLELLDGETEILPGIKIVVLDGHTPGMQTVKVSADGATLWYAADLLPLAALVPLPYIMSYDLYPMTTLAEKKRLLPIAVAERWLVVFEHDERTPAAYITSHEKGFAVDAAGVSL